MEKINTPLYLFRNRTFGEILSDGVNFIQAYSKVLFKSLSLIILPICLIQGYFINSYLGTMFMMGYENNPVSSAYAIGYNLLGVYFLMLVGISITYGLCATLMRWHHEGKLTKNTHLTEMKDDIIRYTIKTFLMFLFIGVIILICVGVFIGIMASIQGFFAAIVILAVIMIITIIILGSPIYLTFYPAYFKDKGIINSFFEGYSLGLKKWGRTFGIAFLMGLLSSIGQGIFILPFYVVFIVKAITLTSPGMVDSIFLSNIAGYISGVILCYGSFIFIPFTFIPMGFNYTSAIEESEGISLQEQIKNFENIQ